MAEILLVHVIDQQQLSADELESQWLPAFAGGVRVAGLLGIADRVCAAQGVRPDASRRQLSQEGIH
jgi:hypothetical protein